WTRAAIANLAEIVLALFCAVIERFLCCDSFCKFPCVSGKVIKHPMYPSAAWSIGIVRNQCETFGPMLGIIPVQWNCDIRAITGVLFRDRLILLKCRTSQFECHGSILRRQPLVGDSHAASRCTPSLYGCAKCTSLGFASRS